VVAALRELPDDARAALLLRVVLDMDYAEIAASLDLPPGTVASHLHRARADLRERLAPEPAPAVERTSQ
jgi:RNA polymerase sigma-70 factor (ECF subfamily)